MDPELVRRELLLLASAGGMTPWEALVRINALAPDAVVADVVRVTSSALNELAAERAIGFAQSRAVRTPADDADARYLAATAVAAVLADPGRYQVPPAIDVRFTLTAKGERLLSAMIELPVPDRRTRRLGRVIAGFADAVYELAERRRPKAREARDGRWQGERGSPWRFDLDDDAGLTGSRVPRITPDRSGSGAAMAVPEPGPETLEGWPEPWAVSDQAAVGCTGQSVQA